MRLTRPGLLLRLEGLAVLALAIWAYFSNGGSWRLLALLIVAPDLSILGFLAGSGVGAAAYNLVHTYSAPALLAGIGLAGDSTLAVRLALIWAAHIGGDRLLGFGLKYPTAFRDSHLQRL